MVEFSLTVKHVGNTSINFTCLVRNKATKKNICLADDIVFVTIDPESRQPIPHGKNKAALLEQTKAEVRSLNLLPEDEK